MSLVGPRPKLPHHEALRMACRPGITGAATLAFRNEEEFLSEIPEDQLETFYETFVKPAKAHLDLEYMRTATLGSDLNILWRTASACLFSGDNAMAESAATIMQYEHAARIRAEKLPSASVGHSMPKPSPIRLPLGSTRNSKSASPARPANRMRGCCCVASWSPCLLPNSKRQQYQRHWL